MSKTVKIILVVIVVVTLAVIAYMIWKRKTVTAPKTPALPPAIVATPPSMPSTIQNTIVPVVTGQPMPVIDPGTGLPVVSDLSNGLAPDQAYVIVSPDGDAMNYVPAAPRLSE